MKQSERSTLFNAVNAAVNAHENAASAAYEVATFVLLVRGRQNRGQHPTRVTIALIGSGADLVNALIKEVPADGRAKQHEEQGTEKAGVIAS